MKINLKEAITQKDFEIIQMFWNVQEAWMSCSNYEMRVLQKEIFVFRRRMGCRCFWDSDTDNYAQDIFMNVSRFKITRYVIHVEPV